MNGWEVAHGKRVLMCEGRDARPTAGRQARGRAGRPGGGRMGARPTMGRSRRQGPSSTKGRSRRQGPSPESGRGELQGVGQWRTPGGPKWAAGTVRGRGPTREGGRRCGEAWCAHRCGMHVVPRADAERRPEGLSWVGQCWKVVNFCFGCVAVVEAPPEATGWGGTAPELREHPRAAAKRRPEGRTVAAKRTPEADCQGRACTEGAGGNPGQARSARNEVKRNVDRSQRSDHLPMTMD